MLDDFSLDLDVPKYKVKEILDVKMPPNSIDEYHQNESFILDTIMQSRYVNLYYLLRVSQIRRRVEYICAWILFSNIKKIQDHLSEESYVAIVRNQILVDVQVSHARKWSRV